MGSANNCDPPIYPRITTLQWNRERSKNLSPTKALDSLPMKGKIFFRIVEAYPACSIGNRQHGLKKFLKLDMDQCKLAAKNLKRYKPSLKYVQ